MARDRDDDDDRYDDRPRERYDRPRERREGEPPPTNGAAMASLVLGLIALVVVLTAIPGLICGIIGLSRAKRVGGAGKGMAIAGTVLSVASIALFGVAVALLLPAVRKVREASSRMVVSNNLKHIGLAMHNHEDTMTHLPSPVVQPPLAPPVPESEWGSRLSWRVEMLPYIEEGAVYNQMNLGQPWDSAQNKPFATQQIRTYSDPDTKTDPDTRYRVFYGPGTAFPLTEPLRLSEIRDGLSNTIFVVESGQKVTWTRFAEIKFDPNNPPDPTTMGRPGLSTFTVLLGDGSVRSFRKNMNPQALKAAITANGDDPIFDE